MPYCPCFRRQEEEPLLKETLTHVGLNSKNSILVKHFHYDVSLPYPDRRCILRMCYQSLGAQQTLVLLAELEAKFRIKKRPEWMITVILRDINYVNELLPSLGLGVSI
jgi:hypothetical protein